MLVIAGAGVVAIAAVLVAMRGGRLAFGDRIGVLEIRGVITDATDAIEALERFRKDDGTLAVVLRIDSPGGAVAPSQELYDEVWRVREAKPVVASLGNVAASGGYYVASAANVILADAGTITGSIGAVMGVPTYLGLAEKIGVGEEIVKSGRFKDTGHPLRPLGPDERALLQAMVDDVLGQFVAAVARGRQMELERVRALADGRIYSGAQAHAAGLVDEIGGLQAAIQLAWARAGQTGEPRAVRVRGQRRAWWLDLLGATLLPPLHEVGGGLLFLYRGPVPE
jgi:protease-4